MTTSIVPDANAQYDLGSAEYKIRDLFLSENSLVLGDKHKLSVDVNTKKLTLTEYNEKGYTGGDDDVKIGSTVLHTIPSSIPFDRVLINTVKEAPILPAVASIITGNGFVVAANGQKYICTTAHAFFAEHQTPSEEGDAQSGIMQNTVTVKVGDKGVGHIDPAEVFYSRSLDVAFIPMSFPLFIGDYPNVLALPFADGIPGEASFIAYSDPLTRTDQLLEGKYIQLVQAQTPSCAVTTASSKGTSGSPAFNDKNQVIGMVSASSESYENMTVCIPAHTIQQLLGQLASTLVVDNMNVNTDITYTVDTTDLKKNNVTVLSVGDTLTDSDGTGSGKVTGLILNGSTLQIEMESGSLSSFESFTSLKKGEDVLFTSNHPSLYSIYALNSTLKNLDELPHCHLGIFTQKVEPLVALYAESGDGLDDSGDLPGLLNNGGGERVVYAEQGSEARPWDILTKVNSITLTPPNSLTKVLLESLSDSADVDVETYRMDAYYHDRFMQISTEAIYCTKGTETDEDTEQLTTVYKVLPEVLFSSNIGSDGKLNLSDLTAGCSFTAPVSDDMNFLEKTVGYGSLFYIGQQLQYAPRSEEARFKKFDRNYTTIVDIQSEDSGVMLTLSTPLASDEYIFAAIPLGNPGVVYYKSPTHYQDGDEESKQETEWFPESTVNEGVSPPIVGKDYFGKDLYRVTITDAGWKRDAHNIAIMQGFLYLLFLCVSGFLCSEQEKINIIETEILRMYKQLSNKYVNLGAFLSRIHLHWLFLAPCLEVFGNNCVQLFNAIPDPTVNGQPVSIPTEEGYANWETMKAGTMSDFYNRPIGTFAQTMAQGQESAYQNGFNTSLKNSQNGYFYGTVSDRYGAELPTGGPINLSQQLSMMLEDLIGLNELEGNVKKVMNTTMVDYLMEQQGVSWNNLLIAHNWRKRNLKPSKLIFKKVDEQMEGPVQEQ